jgi:uncharacterized protein with GYD domain
METYIILSKILPEAISDPKEFKQLAARVSEKIKNDCPGVVWRDSYVTMGRFDVVDIVDAKDAIGVERAAMIIRSLGHSTTETLCATPWKKFLGTL